MLGKEPGSKMVQFNPLVLTTFKGELYEDDNWIEVITYTRLDEGAIDAQRQVLPANGEEFLAIQREELERLKDELGESRERDNSPTLRE